MSTSGFWLRRDIWFATLVVDGSEDASENGFVKHVYLWLLSEALCLVLLYQLYELLVCRERPRGDWGYEVS